MGGSAFKWVVRLEFVERLKRLLLLTLLRPYRRELDSLGLVVDDVTCSDDWLLRLFHILNSDDAAVPSELQAALMKVADVASDSGYRSLLEHARERGLQLTIEGEMLAAEDAALFAYLFHPELFDLVHAGLQPEPWIGYIECTPARPLEDRELSVDVVEQRLRSWVESHDPQRFRRAHVEELSDQFVFYLDQVMGRHAVHKAGEPAWSTVTQHAHALVTYHKRTHHLSISASSGSEEELYRGMAGVVLANDEAFFSMGPVYSAQPLLERPLEALDTRGIEGIDAVRVRRLRYAQDDDAASATEIGAAEFARCIADPAWPARLRSAVILEWSFDVEIPQYDGVLSVDLVVPNWIRLDPRIRIESFRKFLIERGFCCSPRLGYT